MFYALFQFLYFNMDGNINPSFLAQSIKKAVLDVRLMGFNRALEMSYGYRKYCIGNVRKVSEIEKTLILSIK